MASSASSPRSSPSFGLDTVRTFDLGKGITLRIVLGSVVNFDCPDIGAIVNAANEGCLGGGGVDGAISDAGGRKLYRDRLALPVLRHGIRCPTGEVRLTGPGDYDLLKVNYVVHAVGPVYDMYGNFREPDHLLYYAYQASLEACCRCRRRRRSIRTSSVTAPAATATSPTSMSEEDESEPLEESKGDEKTSSIKTASPKGSPVSKTARLLQPSPASSSSSSSSPPLASSAADHLPAHRSSSGDDGNINPRSFNNTRRNSDRDDGDINPRPSSNRRITDFFTTQRGSRSSNSLVNPTTDQVQDDSNTVNNDDAAVVFDDLPIRHVAFSLLSAGIFRGRRSLISVLGIGVMAIRDWVDRTDDCGALQTVILCAFSKGEARVLLEACRRTFPDHR